MSDLAHVAAVVFHDMNVMAVVDGLNSGERVAGFRPESALHEFFRTVFLDCRNEVPVVP